MKRDLSSPLSPSIFKKNGKRNGKQPKEKMATAMCKKGMDAYDSFIKKGKTSQQANKLASKLCN